MYMPGRLRTGSSPSSTVMSRAVYVAIRVPIFRRGDPLSLCVPAPRNAVAPQVDAAEPAIDPDGFDAIHPPFEHRASRVGHLDRGAPGPSLQVAVDAHQGRLSLGHG